MRVKTCPAVRRGHAPKRLPLLAEADPMLASQWICPVQDEHAGRTPHNTTAGSQILILWRCSVNPTHEWESTVGARFRGTGCPHCVRLARGVQPLSEQRPDLAEQWLKAVGPRSWGVTPATVTPGSGALVRWCCPTDPRHEWDATVRRRVKDSRCPLCAGLSKPAAIRVRASTVTRATLGSERPELASQWVRPIDPDDHNRTPVNTSPNSEAWVLWQCPASPSHRWEATVANRVLGHGCPECAPLTQAYALGLITLHFHLRVRSRHDDTPAQDVCLAVEAMPAAASPGDELSVDRHWEPLNVRVGQNPDAPCDWAVESGARLLGLAECPGTLSDPREVLHMAARGHLIGGRLTAGADDAARRSSSEAPSVRRGARGLPELGFDPRTIAFCLSPSLRGGRAFLHLSRGAPFAVESWCEHPGPPERAVAPPSARERSGVALHGQKHVLAGRRP